MTDGPGYYEQQEKRWEDLLKRLQEIRWRMNVWEQAKSAEGEAYKTLVEDLVFALKPRCDNRKCSACDGHFFR